MFALYFEGWLVKSSCYDGLNGAWYKAGSAKCPKVDRIFLQASMFKFDFGNFMKPVEGLQQWGDVG